MEKHTKPRQGSKREIIFNLLWRRTGHLKGATLSEINQAVGWHAHSYINDTKSLAERHGGTPRWAGEGQDRRFWIE